MAQHGGKREGAGRKKSRNSIEAEKAKAQLIKMYLKEVKPINAMLIKKAKEGDMAAVKELHDRVYGRPTQAIVTEDEDGVRKPITGMSVEKDTSTK